MAVSPEILKSVTELLSPSCSLGINIRLQNVISTLESVGLIYSSKLAPAAFLCHPQNRGSSMVNAYNAHRKGHDILQAGVKAELLPPNSLALEVATDSKLKESQFKLNRKMVAGSNGLLAPIRGDERFLTLANSHFVQWARAMDNGCKGPDGNILIVSSDMKPLLKEGWSWRIISGEAEKLWPQLPAFAAMAMNSHNTNQITSNGLECMMQLADLYQAGMKMDEAILAVEHSSPSCKNYLKDVAYFCKMYCGGQNFPLLQCLDHFCRFVSGALCFTLALQLAGKSSGHFLLIGEEMMNHLAFYNFKIPGQSMALTRVALAACMLSSRKHQDNISKLVYKSDFDKMKGKDTTKKLDEILHTLWTEAQDQKHEKSLAFNAFGTACVRMVLHLLQKEKAAKQDTFESFQEIVQKFQDDLSGGGVPAPPAAPPVLATSSAGSSKGVQDLVNCSSKEIALVQNSHIKVGERYIHPDHEDKIFVLSSLEDTGATFQYTPLFGNAVDLTESLDALNKWRPTKKENRSLLDQQLCIQRLPHKYEIVLKDMERIEVNALLVDAYKQNLPKDDAMIGFTQHPSNVVLLKKAKKKEITLFPLGQCSAVADKDLQQVLNKGKQVLVYYNGKAYAIQPFKTWTSF
ncbi:unnamed protein product [Cladocopium goreaui]|uniref:Uncharacterized protein n=1 Tax=Cladocopium goreaui TaxID=2562237 RepID=A0A9P1BZH1_9DINO|nr:unnamed protein product [Cladocopium goreaui]